jgi:hypothetical protein
MARLNRNEAGGGGTTGAVAVTTTPAQVVGIRQNRVSLALRNNGATDVFYGFSQSVTPSTGYPLLPNEEYVFEDFLGAVFIVCATTGDLRFAEIL